MQTPVNRQRYLPYVSRLQARALKAIDTIVIHCTELPDLKTAWEYGQKIIHVSSGSGNCGHFYIDRDGNIEQWAPLDRAAHHVKDHNSNTVGIELVNLGRYPHWYHSEHQHMSEPYPEVQIDALKALLGFLKSTLPELRWITGHEDLDTTAVTASDDPDKLVRRKMDPGTQFPWAALMKAIELEKPA